MNSGHPHTTDAGEILASISGSVRARRQADRDEVELVLAWCDLHTVDPQTQPGAVPLKQGGDRLITMGGDGTPKVSEFCFAELALARQAGVIATRNLAADALDLRHRLPLLYEQVTALRVEVWVARKITAMTRPLDKHAVALVDTAVAAAWQQPAGKLLALAEAKVIEADLDAHRRRVTEDAKKTGVWRTRPRTGDRLGGEAGPGEAATARFAAKLPLAQAIELDTVIDDLADTLAAQLTDVEDQPTRDQLRADALALLADPAKALAMLQGPEAPPVTRPKRDATIYLHLTDTVLAGTPGIARGEDLGPLLLEQVTDLLHHRTVTLQPVRGAHGIHPVHDYEHSRPRRGRTHRVVRTAPEANEAACRGDRGARQPQHSPRPEPITLPGGGPALAPADTPRAPQAPTAPHPPATHDENNHPHGLCRVVTPYGTRSAEPLRNSEGTIIGELYYH